MPESYQQDEFPTYAFSYDSAFGGVEEYAYQNSDIYGDDPDLDEVQADMIASIEGDVVKPFLDFMDVSNYSWHYYKIVERRGVLGFFGEYDIWLDVVGTYEPRDYRSVREAEEEARDIRDWLDTYPRQYGFHFFTGPRCAVGGR